MNQTLTRAAEYRVVRLKRQHEKLMERHRALFDQLKDVSQQIDRAQDDLAVVLASNQGVRIGMRVEWTTEVPNPALCKTYRGAIRRIRNSVLREGCIMLDVEVDGLNNYTTAVHLDQVTVLTPRSVK